MKKTSSKLINLIVGFLILGNSLIAAESLFKGFNPSELDSLSKTQIKAEYLRTRAALDSRTDDDCNKPPPTQPCAARTECSNCIPLSNWHQRTCRVYDCDGSLANTYTEWCD